MDSYIVRIYRRQAKAPHEIVGVVENVELEETMAFKSVDELWEILAEQQKRSSQQNRDGPRGARTVRRRTRASSIDSD